MTDLTEGAKEGVGFIGAMKDAVASKTVDIKSLIIQLKKVMNVHDITDTKLDLREKINDLIDDLLQATTKKSFNAMNTEDRHDLCDLLVTITTTPDICSSAPEILEKIFTYAPAFASKERIAVYAAPETEFEDGCYVATDAVKALAAFVRYNPELGVQGLLAKANIEAEEPTSLEI